MSGYMRGPEFTKRRKFLNKFLYMIKYYLNFTNGRHLDMSEASTPASGARVKRLFIKVLNDSKIKSQGGQLMCS